MYGRIIIIVTKYADIKKNLKLVKFVFNKFITNPKYKNKIIPNAKKLYLKDNFTFIQVNNMKNLEEYSLIEYIGLSKNAQK